MENGEILQITRVRSWEALRNNDIESIKDQLDQGLSVNDSRHGITMLMGAACRGSADIVTLLLARGADATHVDDQGYSALLYAVQEGYEDVVEILFDYHPAHHYLAAEFAL